MRKPSPFIKWLSAAAVIVTGCGGCGAVPSDADQQSAEAALIAVEPLSPINNIAQSFTSPLNARAGRELAYITDYEQSYLYRFTYLQGVQIGYPRVKGIAEPQGECVDKANNVLIANTGAENIIAYSHGSHLVKTLDDPGAQPVGCSIDPTTGNLAVTNMETSGSGNGSVAIYANASGTPTLYSDPTLLRFFFCAYDDLGDLFADGLTKHGFGLAELRKGGSGLIDISLDQTIYFPGGVEWDGRYLAIGDQTVSNVYEFAIKGGKAALRGTTTLGGAGDVVQFWLVRESPHSRASKLVAPDAYNHDVELYRYPTGGTPIRTFAGYHMYEPAGAAVSPNKAL